MKNFINQMLPAGLEDTSLEIYAFGNELMALYNSKRIKFTELPDEILDVFRQAMISDQEAMKTFVSMNISEENDMLIQYVWCNFGGYNKIPDYVDHKICSEYWDCGSRGKCPYEGNLCKAILFRGNIISKRELEIIKLIAQGYADKEIADILKIAYNTMTKHRQNIEKKINAPSKVAVATFAHINNLI